MFMNVIECLRVVREHSRTFEIINDVRRRSETFRDVQRRSKNDHPITSILIRNLININ